MSTQATHQIKETELSPGRVAKVTLTAKNKQDGTIALHPDSRPMTIEETNKLIALLQESVQKLPDVIAIS